MTITTTHALQQAVYGVLHTDSALTALVGEHLYDRIPETAANAATMLCVDACESTPHLMAQARVDMVTLTLTATTRSGSRKTVLDIMERVMNVLEGAVLDVGAGRMTSPLRIVQLSSSPDKTTHVHSATLRVRGWIGG